MIQNCTEEPKESGSVCFSPRDMRMRRAKKENTGGSLSNIKVEMQPNHGHLLRQTDERC